MYYKNIKFIILSLLLLLSMVSAVEFQWHHIYGGEYSDYGQSLDIDEAGNYYLCGRSNSYEGAQSGSYQWDYDFWVIKTDSEGNEIWNRCYDNGVDEWELAYDIKVTSNAEIVVTGHSTEPGSYTDDIFLLKLDTEGDIIWQNLYSYQDLSGQNDYANDTIELEDGFVVSGSTFIDDTEKSNSYFFKTDFDGNKIWEHNFGFGDDSYDVIMKSIATTDNSILLLTQASGYNNLRSILTKRDSETGDEIWEIEFESPFQNYLEPRSLAELSDGYVFVTSEKNTIGGGLYYPVVIKTDFDGNEIWRKTFGTTDTAQHIRDIATDDEDNIYLAGTYYIESSQTNVDALLIKLDSNGDEIYRETYGGNDYEIIHSIKLNNSDNSISIAGSTESSSFGAEDSDFFLVKYSEETGINDNGEWLMMNGELKQNYPNPFNPTTRINYELRITNYEKAEIVVHNSLGQQVWSSGHLPFTIHHSPLLFDGSKFNSGIYYYSLIIDGKKMDTKSMILIK